MTEADDPPRPRSSGRPGFFVAAVLFEGALGPLALGLGHWLGQSPLEGFAWNARDAALGAIAALPMFALFVAGLRRPVGPLARIKQIFDEVLSPLLEGSPLIALAALAVAAGVGEEMLFRGVAQKVLANELGVWGGLAAASLLFGLLHPITPTYVAIAAILGAYLGTLWIVSGNLLTVIVAHALYDFLALGALRRKVRLD